MVQDTDRLEEESCVERSRNRPLLGGLVGRVACCCAGGPGLKACRVRIQFRLLLH